MCKSRLSKTVVVCLSGTLMAFWPALSPAQSTVYSISTVAGNGSGGFAGDAAAATGAQVYYPRALAMDKSGVIYIADQFNHRIRKISTDGTITTVAGNGTGGYLGDGAAATSAELYFPCGVAVDGNGNIFIGDTSNHVVRKVTTDGKISTFAGNNSIGYSGDAAAATSAQLDRPTAVVVDSKGVVYIADTGNHVIRKVATDGTITTFAGIGTVPGFVGDPGFASTAQFYNPEGLALDAAGNLYIADTGNQVIRKISSNGGITTVAGRNMSGFDGDGGPATNALLASPKDLRFDSAGNLYIADYLNNRIRMVTKGGLITTVAGMNGSGFWGDGDLATNALLSGPSNLLVDASGKIYISDVDNNRLRLLTPLAGYPSINVGGVASAGSFGGAATVAPGSWIEIYGSNLATNARPWKTSDFTGVFAPNSLDGTRVTIGGKTAYVGYISPGQVNVQVPSNVGLGEQPLTVTTAAGTSSPASVTVNQTQPGLLAPVAFKIGGKQYVAALFTDNVTYVLPPGAVPGTPSRRAKPGDTITLYGIGFGSVLPDIPAGRIVQQSNTLALPLQVLFGQAQASIASKGLVLNLIGLYQFNVVVPNVAASDAVPLSFTLGGVSGTQTLYIAVGN